MVKKILIVLVLTAACLAVGGCQTVQGLGRDITWLGTTGAKIVK